MKNLILFWFLFYSTCLLTAQSLPSTPDFLEENKPKPQLLLLGTFHFADAGLDWFKPTDIDVMSQQRQAQIKEIVDQLAAFKPTKVAIEWEPSVQPKVDSLYEAYHRGQFELKSNEVYQLGFRLAGRLGLNSPTCVDADGRQYEQLADPVEVGLANDQAHLKPIVDSWDEKFKQLYSYGDSLKQIMAIRDYLLYINSPERLRKGHGHYVYRALAVGNAEQYPVVDRVTSWYNRNLRIFANLLRMIESEDDRIVLIIGSGHIPIIKHAAESSPDVEVVEVSEVLGSW